jgi:Opacity family porin protein
MYRTSLISLTAIFMAVTAAINVNAQDITPKKYSVGPAIEFNGSGTSFGIQGKVNVIPNFSVRPIILFGYTPGVSRNDITIGTGSNSNTFSLSPISQDEITALKNSVPKGTAYGIAITYDFTFPESRISAYVGPRILSSSSSGVSTAINGGVGIGATSASVTEIGLIVGADYAISTDFTAGLNATYNFAKSGSYSIRFPGLTDNIPVSGNDFSIGINVGYNF